MQIDGQHALVAGGASGLGAATARHLASLGARVSLLDFNAKLAAEVAAEIGGQSQACDVTDEASVDAAVTAVSDIVGDVPRIAVNCAGIADAARIVGREGKVSTDVFRRVIDVNLIGSYTVMTFAARAMMTAAALDSDERGVIVNTASIAFEDGQVGQSAYAASKGAIASMCLPAAREFAPHGIRVMAIAPGLFHTPMMEGLPDETVEAITANIPFPGRLGAPEEYARMVAHIVENSYLNGTVIRLDAATRLPPR